MRILFLFSALPILISACGGGGVIDIVADNYRKAILSRVSSTLGTTPENCSVSIASINERNLYKSDGEGETYKVKINSCGSEVIFYESVPYGATKNTPVVIALHQTTRYGKDEVMGWAGDPSLSYGKYFFEQGFVVLAPDVFLAGENYREAIDWDTSEFYTNYPKWSATGKMLMDNMAISAYVKRRYSDVCKVAMGHSLGGFNSVLLGAFDDSVNVIVSSGGFESIALDPNAIDLARDHWFIYMPLLRPFVLITPPRVVPWDFDDVLKAIFPRSVLVIQGALDWYLSSIDSFNYIFDPAFAYFVANGSSNIEKLIHPGAHIFDQPLQSGALEFVKKKCGSK